MNDSRIDDNKIRVSLAKYNPKQSFWRKSSPVVHRKFEMEVVTRNNLYAVERVADEAKLQVLGNFLIGWCKNFIKIGNFTSQMQDNGLAGFSSMRAARNVVLMIFEDSTTLRFLRSVKNEQSETFAEWFSRVAAWSESLVVECRRVRVVCEGIPFNTWNWGTFKNIVAMWGKLLAIDKSSQFPSSFDQAKIQILTKAQVRIDESLGLKVGANFFKILVHEVESSFKPKSWVPEEVVDSLDLVCSLGALSDKSQSGSPVFSSGLNCTDEDVAIETANIEKVSLLKSAKSVENSSNKFGEDDLIKSRSVGVGLGLSPSLCSDSGFHSMEALDHSHLNIVEHLVDKSVDPSDGVSPRASGDVIMMSLFPSNGLSGDAIQLQEDTSEVSPFPGKLRRNRVVKKCKQKKGVLN